MERAMQAFHLGPETSSNCYAFTSSGSLCLISFPRAWEALWSYWSLCLQPRVVSFVRERAQRGSLVAREVTSPRGCAFPTDFLLHVSVHVSLL